MEVKFVPSDEDKKRLPSLEMIFFSRKAGYKNVDHKRNEEILEELKVEPVDERLRRNKSNWLQHVTELTTTGCQK
jgi:hypothetical protein